MKSLSYLIPYLKKYRSQLLWGIGSIILANIFSVVLPHFIGKAVDKMNTISQNNQEVLNEMFWYAVLIISFTFIAGVLLYYTRQTIIVTSRHIEFDLRNDFLEHLQKQPYSYFQKTPTGDLMAHATNDINAVRNVLGPGIMYPIDSLMGLIFSLSFMFAKSWSLTLIALIPLPLVSYVVYRVGRSIHTKSIEKQESYSKLTTRAQENLSGIRIVKSYVREKYEIDLFEKLSQTYFKKNMQLAKIQSLMWPLMFMLVGSSILLTIYFGGLSVINKELTIGTLTAFLSYLVMLIWPMIALGWVINILQQGAASMSRLQKIIDRKSEISNNDLTNYTIKEVEGEIEFKNVSFKHDGSNFDTIKNINLKIPKGSTLAIVGKTGSGKSTLVNLIPRLYDITDGELLIDGKNVKQLPLEVLRTQIGFVPQETFLFSETISENIFYGVEEKKEDDLIESAKISQISVDVEEFPKKFETVIGERGITLSGGQKQRTSIARAIIKTPKILIIDDALSAVDTDTEDKILHQLRAVMKGRTSIIISHRISTVKDADYIIVLENGAIAEKGTHDELLIIKGIYSDLYGKQLLEQELEELK
ncbi:MAG: ABC transporter ATP-binding protein [Bacteroidetes bacterium]|nr:ABC transporter ATP-binding protein [Bacteroidota bacterium]